jgi:hypothetical protein
MKIPDDSPFFHGASGKFGNMVFRQRNGKTYVSSLPCKSTHKLSESQFLAQQRFREAAAYAKAMIDDPETRAALTKRLGPGQTAYTLAMSDYYKANSLK